jgi:hypothetical protein
MWLCLIVFGSSLSSMLRTGPHATTMCAMRMQQEHLSVGDWVSELVLGPVPSLESRVKGPYQIVDIAGPGGQIAVLQTKRTEFAHAGDAWHKTVQAC